MSPAPHSGTHYDRIETASRDELTALQLERLKRSLKHTYDNVAPYRAKCEQACVHPDDLKELADLARLPFTVKQDLRDSYPYGMLAVPLERVVRLHASSGTTGRPTLAWYTRRDLRMWASLMARSMYGAGVRHSDKVLVSFGYGLFTGGLGTHYGAERLGATVIPMGGGNTERQVQLIRDLEPGVVMATPSYILVIAEEMARQGLDPRRSSVRISMHGAEPWTEGLRAEIEQRFDSDALDLYGLTEVIGPGVAAEYAATKNGLTIWEDHFYPEIIDPETGRCRPDGELGELVLTSLTKEAMPLIRYRTRDLTRLLPGTAGGMRRLAMLTGRTDDMLIIRGVNVFPSQIEELVLACEELTPVYQLRVSKAGPLDKLDVHVEARHDVVERIGREGVEQVSSDLRHRVKSLIGVTCDVRVLKQGEIERTVIGKTRRVIDLRSQAGPAHGGVA
jgi:phenylacetate-CoA ligase